MFSNPSVKRGNETRAEQSSTRDVAMNADANGYTAVPERKSMHTNVQELSSTSPRRVDANKDHSKASASNEIRNDTSSNNPTEPYRLSMQKENNAYKIQGIVLGIDANGRDDFNITTATKREIYQDKSEEESRRYLSDGEIFR